MIRPPLISYSIQAPPSGEVSCPVERSLPDGSILQEATGGANPLYCTTFTQPRALKSQNRTVLSPRNSCFVFNCFFLFFYTNINR